MLLILHVFFNSHNSNGVTYTHGILEGSPHTVNIRSQEELAGFLVRAGVFIDQLTIFVRYDGGEYRTYGPYGGFGGAPHLIFADKISAIHGSAGDILDRFGCRGRF